MLLVNPNEPDAEKRTVMIFIVGTDGMSNPPDQAGGQPEISMDSGRTWTTEGISPLGEGDDGYYPATLWRETVAVDGLVIRTRYKSAATARCPGDTVQVMAFPTDTAAVRKAVQASTR